MRCPSTMQETWTTCPGRTLPVEVVPVWHGLSEQPVLVLGNVHRPIVPNVLDEVPLPLTGALKTAGREVGATDPGSSCETLASGAAGPVDAVGAPPQQRQGERRSGRANVSPGGVVTGLAWAGLGLGGEPCRRLEFGFLRRVESECIGQAGGVLGLGPRVDPPLQGTDPVHGHPRRCGEPLPRPALGIPVHPEQSPELARRGRRPGAHRSVSHRKLLSATWALPVPVRGQPGGSRPGLALPCAGSGL